MKPAAPVPATPIEEAQQQLGALVAAGTAADAMTLAVGELVSGWAAEPEMDVATARARVEALFDGLDRDAADLREQISDAEGSGAPWLAEARRVLRATHAAVSALRTVHGRLAE